MAVSSEGRRRFELQVLIPISTPPKMSCIRGSWLGPLDILQAYRGATSDKAEARGSMSISLRLPRTSCSVPEPSFRRKVTYGLNSKANAAAIRKLSMTHKCVRLQTFEAR